MKNEKTAEQMARDMLARLSRHANYANPQAMSNGDVMELANLIAELHGLRRAAEPMKKYVAALIECRCTCHLVPGATEKCPICKTCRCALNRQAEPAAEPAESLRGIIEQIIAEGGADQNSDAYLGETMLARIRAALNRQAEPTRERVCPDSADGQHVLKQDGPFSIVYCDACGMNRGWRTQEPDAAHAIVGKTLSEIGTCTCGDLWWETMQKNHRPGCPLNRSGDE